ncbi:MAG: AsmA family protein, partial [Vulcanimicrobiaceae bacterium]
MKRFFAPVWVRIAFAAAILLVAAVVAAPFLIPVNTYRPLIVAAIENATGRQVQIDALRLRITPRVRITLENVRVRNPSGFPAGDAFVAKTIDLGIKPQALLSRHLIVTYIAPSGVELNVVRNEKGATNLALAPRGGGSPAQGVLTIESIGRVRVSDAKISFSSVPVGTQPSYAIAGVNGTIAAISPQSKDWFKTLEVDAELAGRLVLGVRLE